MRVEKGTGGKRAKWFRPSDVAVGVDGSIYVADWYDPGVGGHAAGDRAAYGRILRVRLPGTKLAARADVTTPAGLVEALHNPAVNVRGLAFRRLRAGGEKYVASVLRTWRSGDDPRARARALYWLAGTENGDDYLREALRDEDPDLRITGIRAVRQKHSPSRAFPMIRERAADPSPAVRREVLLGMVGVPLDTCMPALLEIAANIDTSDRVLIEAFGIAARGRESAVYTELLLAMGDQPRKWTERFATLAWRLHPQESVPAHLARAMSKSLSPTARSRAVDAIAFVPTKAAAEAMLSIAQVGPAGTQALAAFWLQNRATNDWSAFGVDHSVGGSGRSPRRSGDAKLLWRSGVMQKGTREFDVAVTPGRTIWLEVSDGGDGYSCDWADWINPRFQPKDSAKGRNTPLMRTRWLEAKAGWGKVQINKNASGGKLSIDGAKKLRGIGTHAPSVIAYRVPIGAGRLIGSVGPDFGGTRQGGATSIEFLIYIEEEADRSHLIAWRTSILDPKKTPAARIAVVKKMASDKDGGLILLGLIEQGRLPDDLKKTVASAIFKNPDQSVRLMATKYFPMPGMERAKLPPIEEIAKLEGVPKNGGAIFRARCAACHVFRGTGLDIGPDLGQMHRKYGTAALLETILNPNSAISFGYENWLIETKKGEFLMGFILAEGDKLVLKDQTGKRHIIAKDEIKTRQKSPTSLMPAGLVADLSAQTLADLAAFVLRDPNAELKLGEKILLFNGEDLSGWTHHLRGKNARAADVWSVADGVLSCKGRPAGYIRTEKSYTNYVLTLKWRFDGRPGNSGVLLRMVGRDKVWPKSIEAQLMHKNAGDIWNIDKFPMQADSSRTSGRHTVKAEPTNEKPIGEWNEYKIILNGGDLTLIVNGTVQNRATWCEEVPGKICLQSEGAPIEFKDIVLRRILQ